MPRIPPTYLRWLAVGLLLLALLPAYLIYTTRKGNFIAGPALLLLYCLPLLGLQTILAGIIGRGLNRKAMYTQTILLLMLLIPSILCYLYVIYTNME